MARAFALAGSQLFRVGEYGDDAFRDHERCELPLSVYVASFACPKQTEAAQATAMNARICALSTKV